MPQITDWAPLKGSHVDNELDTLQSTPWHGDLFGATKLTKSQQRVVESLSLNPKFAAYAELNEVAERAAVNSSTVVRTAQTLGYTGWPDLQRELRAQFLVYISRDADFSQQVVVESPVHDSLAHDAKNLEIARNLIDAQKVTECVEVLCTAKRIICLGQGSHAAPSMVFAHLASVMGYPASFEQRTGVHLAAILNTLTEGDVLLISHLWRPLKEYTSAARIASASKAKVITITDLTTSALAKYSDLVLPVPSEGVFTFQSATAAVSVAYGLLAGMENHESRAIRPRLVNVHELWNDLGIYES